MSDIWVLSIKNEGCRNDKPLCSTLWAGVPISQPYLNPLSPSLLEVHKKENWNQYSVFDDYVVKTCNYI